MKKSTVRSGQCLMTLLIALIAAATLAIPFIIDDANGSITYSYQVMPFLKLSETPISLEFMANIDNSLLALFNLTLDEQLLNLIYNVSYYTIYAFYGIIAFDIVFALLTLLTQFSGIRVFARIISIIGGIAMIFIAIISLAHIIGLINYYIILSGTFQPDLIMQIIKLSGVLLFIGMFIFSLVLIRNQFSWFAKKDLDD